jgi:pimeloyl-ACP methyl ester carboxylesterase
MGYHAGGSAWERNGAKHTMHASAPPVVLIGGMYSWPHDKSPLGGLLGAYFPASAQEWKGKVIEVTIGAVSSDYDRACEAYYQLVGGRVDYGKHHSTKMQHARYGEDYTGKAVFPDWGEHKPVHLIGHSLGGTTAGTLYQLIASDHFGIGSNYKWVKSIVTIASPLRGSSLNYMFGFNALQGTQDELKWHSGGRLMSSLSGLGSKITHMLPITKTLLFDFRHPQWDNCDRNGLVDVLTLSHPFLATHDNSAYDVTILHRKRLNEALTHMDKVVLINVVTSTAYTDTNPCIARQKAKFRRYTNMLAPTKPLFRRLYDMLATGHRFGALLGIALWVVRAYKAFGLRRFSVLRRWANIISLFFSNITAHLARLSSSLISKTPFAAQVYSILARAVKLYADLRVQFLVSFAVHYWAGVLVLSYAFRRHSQRLYPNVGESPLLLSLNWFINSQRFPPRVLEQVPFREANWHENDGIVNTIGQTWPKEVFPSFRAQSKAAVVAQALKRSAPPRGKDGYPECVCADATHTQPYCTRCTHPLFVDIDSGEFCVKEKHHQCNAEECARASDSEDPRVRYKPFKERLVPGHVYRWRVAGNHMVGTALGDGFYRDFVFKGIFDMLGTLE